ncbi:MAG: NADH-quinone oxidoreductase subunit N [Chloroflexi bacterium]|nr:NADH-quinone oxidoreductase subunit N [Chloroflexota bacterium]
MTFGEVVYLTLPEIIIFCFAILAFGFDLAATRLRRNAYGVLIARPQRVSWLPYFALAGLTLALLATALLPGANQVLFSGMFAVDPFAVFFKVVAYLAVGLVVLFSVDYMASRPFSGEFYGLLLLSALSITLVAASTNLIMIFLSLEFLSISSYILVGYLREDARSSEAALKYFLFGAMASAAMLYGMSLIYGLTGSLGLAEIARFFTSEESPGYQIVIYPAAVLVLAGLGFKIAAVPFHQWAPDTYEGAPTPVTAFLSVAPKAAGFAALLRFFITALPHVTVDWALLIAVVSVATMTVGNLIAIAQANVKRMLAYSSIAQAGYVLIGLAAVGSLTSNEFGTPAVLIYLLGYLFTNLGAFIVVIVFERATGSNQIADYAGLMRRAPFLAVSLVVFFLSLTGFPSTAGFIGKLFVFASAIQGQLVWLAILGVVNSVISVYYYFNVVRQMFFLPARDTSPIAETVPLRWALLIALAMTFVIGLYPQPFVELVRYSAQFVQF